MNFLKRLRIFFKNIVYIISTTEQIYTTKKDIQNQAQELLRIKNLLKNHDRYINGHTDQLQAFRDTVKEFPQKFVQLGKAHTALKADYERSQLQNKEQLAGLQEQLVKSQEKLSRYEEIHDNTQRAMYHFVQQRFLAQSLLYHDKLQTLLQSPTTQNAHDFTKEYLDTYYLAFEDRFRGSRNSILDRYAEYYRFVPNTPQNALDIGCGRGEWVELLQAKGINAHGVDRNTAMLQVAKDAGVQNLHDEDAFVFLQKHPAQSFDLITAFHIIEHIPFEKLLLLLSEIKRVAKEGATVLLETPNPANLQVAATHFYNDPTHLNPLPHRVMEFMLEYLGFFEVKTHHINPYADVHHLGTNTPEASTLNRYLFGAQDYIITAKA
jgi:O-antigen chain-terminating methyltransferase